MVVKVSLSALTVLLLVDGCASGTSSDSDRASLLRTDQEWAAVASEGKDIDKIVSYWADDATVFPADAPVVKGKAAIRQFVEDSLRIPGFSITWRPDQVVVSPSGDFGYTTGENQITVPSSDGGVMTIRGRGVAVWRKEPDGTWKCVIDIWNSGPKSAPGS
jgi:ketosteroid isomerase-like protein